MSVEPAIKSLLCIPGSQTCISVAGGARRGSSGGRRGEGLADLPHHGFDWCATDCSAVPKCWHQIWT